MSCEKPSHFYQIRNKAPTGDSSNDVLAWFRFQISDVHRQGFRIPLLDACDLVPFLHLASIPGYHLSKRAYPGKMALSSLLKSAKNKYIDIAEGGEKYQIKGCAGQGGFAQVFKVYLNSNPDDVALKRKSFDFAQKYCTSTLTTAMERMRTKTRVDDDCVDDDSQGGRT
ncbi:hypothetical protein OROMI_007294 [Orobanche minor]